MIEYLYDPEHPLKCPALGILLSKTTCAFGHDIVVMEREEWDREWLACSVCGARFMPASVIDEDTDVIRV